MAVNLKVSFIKKNCKQINFHDWVLIPNLNNETLYPKEDGVYKLPQHMSKTILSAFLLMWLVWLGFKATKELICSYIVDSFMNWVVL